MSALIKVTKDGEELDVHPSCLSDHQSLGWKQVPIPVKAEKTLDDLNGNELKEWLTAKGVNFPGNISKADALALAKETEAE